MHVETLPDHDNGSDERNHDGNEDVHGADGDPQREESLQDVQDGDMSASSGEEAVLIDTVDGAAHDNRVDRVDLFQTLGGMLVMNDSSDEEQSFNSDEEDIWDNALVYASNTYMRSMRARLMRIGRWDRILSLLCLDGRDAFTENQFNTLRKALMERDKTLKIPDPRTVKNSLRRSLLLHSFPKSKVTFVRHNTEANMCTSQTVSVDSVAGTSPTDCVRLVLPSQWVKLDVACLQFYRSVFPEVHDVDGCTRTQTDVNIEDTLAVTDRSLSFLRKNILRAKFHGTHATWHTSPGDMISFPCSR